MHFPHPVHLLALMLAFPPDKLIALCGQADRQSPQPVHFELLTEQVLPSTPPILLHAVTIKVTNNTHINSPFLLNCFMSCFFKGYGMRFISIEKIKTRTLIIATNAMVRLRPRNFINIVIDDTQIAEAESENARALPMLKSVYANNGFRNITSVPLQT